MANIGNDIEIGTQPVEPGLSNLGRIRASNIEDNVPGEGKIFYDIRFSAYAGEEEMKILINVEAQRSADHKKLGYHLENRIIFYLARMISAQKQTEFYHSDFDNIKKSRSIWICLDSAEDGDSIEEIGLNRKTIFGRKADHYPVDLMKGIVINIRSASSVRASKNILVSMLEHLLSQTDVEEKKRILHEEYGMVMTVELERRFQSMCNLSEAIKEQGIEQGMEQGKLELLKYLMDLGKMTLKEAADSINMSVGEFSQKLQGCKRV